MTTPDTTDTAAATADAADTTTEAEAAEDAPSSRPHPIRPPCRHARS